MFIENIVDNALFLIKFSEDLKPVLSYGIVLFTKGGAAEKVWDPLIATH